MKRQSVALLALRIVYLVTGIFIGIFLSVRVLSQTRNDPMSAQVARIQYLCSELLRNQHAGILFIIPRGARPTDRICDQQEDVEQVKCRTVLELRESWKEKQP